jgi:hypothetical protein
MRTRRLRFTPFVALAATAALALAPLTTAPASAAAPKNNAFTIGQGEDPTIAVDKAGTAYVTWVHQGPSGNQDQLQFCKIPRGKRKCTDLQTFSAPLATGDRAQILMPNPTTVYIVYYEYAGPYGIPSPDQTWLLTSTDAGATFGAPVYIGTQDPEGQAALDANGGLYLAIDSSTYGITVQRDNLNGTAVPADGTLASFTQDWYGGQVAVAATGQVIASSWNETDGVGLIHLWSYSGTGDPNATTSWVNSQTLRGEDTQLSNGPKGPVLFYTPNASSDPPFVVAKLTPGGTVSASVTVVKAGQANEQPTFWEDAAGRINLAYTNSNGLSYQASDLKGFKGIEALKSDGGYHQRGATAADGGGFIAFDNEDATGPVTLVPIPVRRIISENVKGSTLSGKVAPAVTGQAVQLQAYLHNKWVLLKTAAISAKHTYAFKLPSGHRTYRAVAVETEGYAIAIGVNKKH